MMRRNVPWDSFRHPIVARRDYLPLLKTGFLSAVAIFARPYPRMIAPFRRRAYPEVCNRSDFTEMMEARKFPRLIAAVLAAFGCVALPNTAWPQDSQSPSVADAARRARQDKNSSKPTSRPSKVITDDDLSSTAKSAEGVNVGAPPKLETQPPSKSAVAATEAADQVADSGKADVKKGDDPEIAKAKEDLAKASKELDLLQRELALDQDTFYSNTDYVHDKAGQTRLAGEQQQINVKQQEVSALKAHLQELEAKKKPATAASRP